MTGQVTTRHEMSEMSTYSCTYLDLWEHEVVQSGSIAIWNESQKARSSWSVGVACHFVKVGIGTAWIFAASASTLVLLLAPRRCGLSDSLFSSLRKVVLKAPLSPSLPPSPSPSRVRFPCVRR